MSSHRGGGVLWNNAALTTGSATADATPGANTNVVLFIISDTNCALTIQAATAPSGAIGPGMNTDLSGATWCNYVGFDTLNVTANVPVAVDLSPFAPQFVRVLNAASGSSNIAHLTVIYESSR